MKTYTYLVVMEQIITKRNESQDVFCSITCRNTFHKKKADKGVCSSEINGEIDGFMSGFMFFCESVVF